MDDGEAGGEEHAPPWWRRLARVRIRRPSTHRREGEVVSRVTRLAYALVAGVLWGGAAAFSPRIPGWAAGAILAVGSAAIYWGSGALLSVGGGLISVIHLPSGSSRAAGAGYSRAEALAARGLHGEAARLYEEAADGDPIDPEPCLRLARLHRDGTGDPGEAARWFREARRREGAGPDLDRQISRELIELHRRRLDDPRRAMPELARFAERFPDDPWAEEVREELERLREEMAGRERG